MARGGQKYQVGCAVSATWSRPTCRAWAGVRSSRSTTRCFSSSSSPSSLADAPFADGRLPGAGPRGTASGRSGGSTRDGRTRRPSIASGSTASSGSRPGRTCSPTGNGTHLEWDANDLLAKLRTTQLKRHQCQRSPRRRETSHGFARRRPSPGDPRPLHRPISTSRPRTTPSRPSHMAFDELRPYASPWGDCVATPEPRREQLPARPRRVRGRATRREVKGSSPGLSPGVAVQGANHGRSLEADRMRPTGRLKDVARSAARARLGGPRGSIARLRLHGRRGIPQMVSGDVPGVVPDPVQQAGLSFLHQVEVDEVKHRACSVTLRSVTG